MISRALNALGLVTRVEHERAVSDRVSIAVHNDVVNAFKEQLANKEAKFKLATTDLEKQAGEIAAHKDAIAVLKEMVAQDAETIEALAPDALLWRAAREKRAARKGSVS